MGSSGRVGVDTTRATSDTELIAGIRAAEGGAVRMLLDRYSRLVHRVATEILHDATEAEDVTAGGLRRAVRKAHLYDRRGGRCASGCWIRLSPQPAAQTDAAAGARPIAASRWRPWSRTWHCTRRWSGARA